MKKTIDYIFYTLPISLFFILFFFYGYGQVSGLMMNKIAGLLAFTLLGLTLALGPLSHFVPHIFDGLKKYRKYLGISGFIIAVIHGLLSTVFYFKMNISLMFDSKNPHLSGVYVGLVGLLLLLFITLTSNKKAIQTLGFQKWKALQNISYVAFALTLFHFVLMETNKGLFIIRRPLGQVIFYFGFVVLIVRIISFIIVSVKKGKK